MDRSQISQDALIRAMAHGDGAGADGPVDVRT
jgi:hypothetical protein